MLADKGEITTSAGSLRDNVHFPHEWRSALIAFIAKTLPQWRDDPRRPLENGETILTAQLCSFLNSATRLNRGWDFLQFRREEPDEVVRGRAIDLVAAPSGVDIWVDGREYSEYCTLLPIECKRLPTPKASNRDEREYLYNQHGSTGGVQRFKAGHHGASHNRAAMIAYIQERDIPFWGRQLDAWVAELTGRSVFGWANEDLLQLNKHDSKDRVAILASRHSRSGELDPIELDHLWVEM